MPFSGGETEHAYEPPEKVFSLRTRALLKLDTVLLNIRTILKIKRRSSTVNK